MATEKTKKTTKVKSKKEYIYGLGRRRTASARVRIYLKSDKKGEIEVNKKKIEEYFPGEMAQKLYLEPLRVCNIVGKYYISALIAGSGKQSQLDAFVHGVSRALVVLDEENYRPILKKRDFLTRDPRMRERRKVGTGGKARRQKQSPKR